MVPNDGNRWFYFNFYPSLYIEMIADYDGRSNPPRSFKVKGSKRIHLHIFLSMNNYN